MKICVPLGWGEIKKCSPIDSGILVEYADIYRRLLGQKIQVLNTKNGRQASLFYGIRSTTMAASRNSKWPLVKIFDNNAPILLLDYAFYI